MPNQPLELTAGDGLLCNAESFVGPPQLSGMALAGRPRQRSKP
jgi:hypothetical protein